MAKPSAAVHAWLMGKIISILLGIVAVIHLLPLAGVLGPQRLQSLYGLAFTEPELVILMQHRAVLFGLNAASCW